MVLKARDPFAHWQASCVGGEAPGTVLIRPDGHVAWMLTGDEASLDDTHVRLGVEEAREELALALWSASRGDVRGHTYSP